MATLVGNSKYGEGHEVILKGKGKVSTAVEMKFQAKGYRVGEARFAVTMTRRAPTVTIDLGTGNDQILLKDSVGKVVAVVGSANSINGSFNHFSPNAKSDTKILTEIKETVSMLVFQSFFERNEVLSEDELIGKLSDSHANKYDSTYYESSIKQLNELTKYVRGGGYTYERQGEQRTNGLYRQARSLSALSNDNWNPADVWMIKKTFTGFDKQFSSIAELNNEVAAAFISRDVIPISLKHVTTNVATSEIVEPTGPQDIDLDMSLAKVDLSESFNNFIVHTRSGFLVRVGFKASSSTLDVSMEGRMAGAGHQMGGIDAKMYRQHCRDNYGYTPRSGGAVTTSDMTTAKRELKAIMAKHRRISTTIATYDQAIDLFNAGDTLTKKRFANLISYLYSVLIAPNSFQEHMKFCYFSSKKMSDKSSTYLLLK